MILIRIFTRKTMEYHVGDFVEIKSYKHTKYNRIFIDKFGKYDFIRSSIIRAEIIGINTKYKRYLVDISNSNCDYAKLFERKKSFVYALFESYSIHPLNIDFSSKVVEVAEKAIVSCIGTKRFQL